MRSKTAAVAATLLVAAVGSRALQSPGPTDADRAAVALDQFRDPHAAARLRDLDARRRWDDAGWLASCGGLAAVAVGAAVAGRVSRPAGDPPHTPNT